jgi:hypothetical protein
MLIYRNYPVGVFVAYDDKGIISPPEPVIPAGWDLEDFGEPEYFVGFVKGAERFLWISRSGSSWLIFYRSIGGHTLELPPGHYAFYGVVTKRGEEEYCGYRTLLEAGAQIEEIKEIEEETAS